MPYVTIKYQQEVAYGDYNHFDLSSLEMSVKVIQILKTCVPHEEAEFSYMFLLGHHVRLQSIDC